MHGFFTYSLTADYVGTLLGLEHSLFAFARIATPQIGVNLLQSGGIPLVSGKPSLTN